MCQMEASRASGDGTTYIKYEQNFKRDNDDLKVFVLLHCLVPLHIGCHLSGCKVPLRMVGNLGNQYSKNCI